MTRPRRAYRQVQRVLVVLAFVLCPALRAQDAPGKAVLQSDSTTLVLTARPGTLATVGVPVPGHLKGDTLTYAVEVWGSNQVLGKRQGTISRADQAHVLLTVMLSAGVEASRTRVAEVAFTGKGERASVVVELEVPRRVETAFWFESRTSVLMLGRQGEVGFYAENRGNAPDTVDVQADVPPGWEARALPARVVLAPGEQVQGRLLLMPGLGASGRQSVRAWLRGRADTLYAPIRVMSEAPGRGGPLVRTALTVNDALGPAALLGEVGASGALGRGYFVDAQASYLQRTARAGQAQADLASLPPYLYLYTAQSALNLGLTSVSLSPLTGLSRAGIGVHASTLVGRFTPGLFAMRDEADAERYSYGTQVGATYGRAQMQLIAAHVAGRTVRQKPLDAASYLITLPFDRNQVGVEIGVRSVASDTRVGVAGLWQRKGERLSASLRASHVPGGSATLAQGENQVSLSSDARLHRMVGAGVSAWYTDDGGEMGARSRVSQGQSGRITLRPWKPFSVLLNGYRFDYAARTALGRQRTQEHGLVGSVSYVTGPVLLGAFTRQSWRSQVSALLATQRDGAASLSTYGANVDVALGTSALRVSGEVNENAVGRGLPGKQGFLRVSLMNVTLLRWRFLHLQGSGTVTRSTTFDAYPDYTTYSGTLTLSLPGRTQLSVAGMRDPFAGTARSPWRLTFRLQKGISAPPLLHDYVGGSVFEDRNGNGRRDAGERGLPGVLLLYGETSATTTSDGTFTLPTIPGQEAPRLDMTTLPDGWLARPALEADRRFLFGLVPVAPVRAHLVLDEQTARRVPQRQLTQIQVEAHRDDGKRWRARHVTADEVMFPALPPGTYTLAIDARELAEPLSIVGEAPRFSVGEAPVPPITLPLRGRSMQIRSKPATDAPPAPASENAAPERPPAPTGQVEPTEASTAASERSPATSLSNPNHRAPGSPPAAERSGPVVTYTVRAGDWLTEIARQLYGDPNQWVALLDANRALISDPNVLAEGTVLRVPLLPHHPLRPNAPIDRRNP